MAELSYTPTFHHTNWVDRVDRVEAGGPNGFNTRFHAIDSDLRQLSTVVAQINTAIADLGPPGSPGTPPTTVTFTPALRPFLPIAPWAFNDNGALVTTGPTANGIATVAPPDGVKLNAVRVVGDFEPLEPGFASLFVSVSRAPVRLTIPPTTPTVIASADLSFFGPFDVQMVVSAAASQIDLNTFRYFITAQYEEVIGGGTGATIDFFQFQFTP